MIDKLSKKRIDERKALLDNHVLKKYAEKALKYDIYNGNGIRLSDLELTLEEEKAFPKVLQLRAAWNGDYREVRVNLDESLFEGYAYRGLNGPKGERVQECLNNGIKFKPKTSYSIVNDYIKDNQIKTTSAASNTGLITTSTNPYCIFAGDSVGRFLSPDGHAIVLEDYSDLKKFEGKSIIRLSEVIFSQVPNSKVKYILMPQKDAKMLMKKYGTYSGFKDKMNNVIITHDWKTQENVMLEGLADIIALTCKENNFSAPRYKSAEDFKRASETARKKCNELVPSEQETFIPIL